MEEGPLKESIYLRGLRIPPPSNWVFPPHFSVSGKLRDRPSTDPPRGSGWLEEATSQRPRARSFPFSRGKCISRSPPCPYFSPWREGISPQIWATSGGRQTAETTAKGREGGTEGGRSWSSANARRGNNGLWLTLAHQVGKVAAGRRRRGPSDEGLFFPEGLLFPFVFPFLLRSCCSFPPLPPPPPPSSSRRQSRRAGRRRGRGPCGRPRDRWAPQRPLGDIYLSPAGGEKPVRASGASTPKGG